MTDKARRALYELKVELDKGEKDKQGMFVKLDEDLATEEAKGLIFTRKETNLINETVDELIRDEGFEYLHSGLRKLVIDLACKYSITGDDTLFETFIVDHFKEPQRLRIYIPIEGLEAIEDVTIHNIKIRKLPIKNVVLKDNGYFEGIKTIAETIVSGTDSGRMYNRALTIVNYELKLLRVSLRGHNQIHDQQLRFRASKGWAIEDGRIGWLDHKDTIYPLGISNKFLEEFSTNQPLYKIPLISKTKLDRKMKLAVEWLDQSRLATDPLARLLYDMFALETILGDKSEGPKARALAFRRALLSTIIHGHYPDPNKVLSLYDQVRSYAVHGEEIEEFNERDAKSFSWSVREAMNEYLEIVESNGFTKPQQVRDYFKQHEKHDELFNWLVSIDPGWEKVRGKI